MSTIPREQLWPKFLREDRNGNAMIAAMEAAMNILLTGAQNGAAYVTDIEKMPEWRLDEMAWELNALWYDYDAGEEDKREQIRTATAFYNRIGTKSAVKSTIAAVFGDGTVQEWWEYDGTPYHYKVTTTDTEAMTTKRKKFMDLLSAVVNLRSVLDDMSYYGAEAKANYYTAAGMVGAEGQSMAEAIAE